MPCPCSRVSSWASSLSTRMPSPSTRPDASAQDRVASAEQICYFLMAMGVTPADCRFLAWDVIVIRCD